MEAGKISRLRDEQEKAFCDTEEQIKKFENFKSDYKALQTRLKTLPDKLSHDIMVPFGKMAFMPGKIVKTNEILVLLGDNWFAEQSAKQASEIAGRRITELDKRIDGLKQQQRLLETRLGFTSELKNMSQGSGDYKEIVEEYNEEKEKLWDEKHKESVRRHHEQLRKEKDSSKLPNTKNENNTKTIVLPTPSPIGDNLWSRLEELEKQEDERGELNSSFEVSDEDERGSTLVEKSESGTQGRKVVWEDEKGNQSSTSNDSDDDEEEEDENDTRKPVIKTITFTHTKVPETIPSKTEPPNSSSITSPGEIYKVFCPKSILRKTGKENTESFHRSNKQPKTQTRFTQPDAAGDYGNDLNIVSKDSMEVNQTIGGGVTGDITTSRDKAFTGVIMENPVKKSVPSSSSFQPSQSQPPTKRVSKFKAQRMGQKPS